MSDHTGSAVKSLSESSYSAANTSNLVDDSTQSNRIDEKEKSAALDGNDHEFKSEAQSSSHNTNTESGTGAAGGLTTRNDDANTDASIEEKPEDMEDHHFFAMDFSLAREIIFVLTIMCAQLITQIGVGQGIPLTNIYAKTFNTTNTGELSWFQAGYSLTVGTFILIAGRLGDIYGNKNLFVCAWVIYAIGALITGLSSLTSNGIFFCAARGLLGIGPSFLLPNGIALLGKGYPPGNRKNLVFSFFGACAPSGFILGAVFACLFGQFTSTWGWAYYVGAIVGVLLAILSYFIIPKDEVDSTGYAADASDTGKFDYFGALTGVAGLILFNAAWNQGPGVGWSTPYVYVLLILGVLLLVGFYFIEGRTAAPLVPLSVLNKKVSAVLFVIYLGWSTFGIFIFYLFQIQLNLRHATPLIATANMVPIAPAGMVASFTTAIMLKYKLPISSVMLCAMCAFTAAPILVSTLPIHQTYWAQIFVTSITACFGMDMSFPAATILMSDLVPREHQGMAASLVTTVVNYSISIGLGMAGTVERYIEPHPTTVREKLHGYRSALYLGIGFSGLGIIVSLVFLYTELKARKANRSPASSHNATADA